MESLADSAHVIRAVSESLRSLIRSHIPALAPESAVVFDSPAEIEADGETRLSLYLYQAETNVYLRNLPPVLQRGASSMQLTPPPLVVDLMYLMVPYAKSAELELVLLDQLVQLLHDYPALQGEWLHPVLRQTGNEPIPITPDAVSIDTLRHIWAGFPNKAYKVTKVYLLSPVRIPSVRRVQQVPMVLHSDVQVVQE
jgi:hypothetical protein